MKEALADMDELLSKPRIIRELAQGTLRVVAALAGCMAAEKDAAVTAARQDKAIAEMQMQVLVVDYLDALDCLHPLGLFEYAEHKLFGRLRLGTSPEDRMSKWQQLSRRRPMLEACILAANPSWRSDLIPAKAVQLYSQLCSQPALQESVFGISSYREMPLVEGPLSPEDMRFLKCLADAVHCPCVLRYKQNAQEQTL